MSVVVCCNVVCCNVLCCNNTKTLSNLVKFGLRKPILTINSLTDDIS